MTEKSSTTLSIYISPARADDLIVERLGWLADKTDRSVNYLVVEAILEYLDREEARSD
jgi:predicted transcriptional regulator